MALSWDITGSLWQLKGELTFEGVSTSIKAFRRAWPKSGAWQIDCAKLTKADSAGAALLLDCVRYAKQHSLTLAIQQIPNDLKQLMHAQGVLAVFEESLNDR